MKTALITFLLLAPGLAFSAEPAKSKSTDKKSAETKTDSKGKNMFAVLETSIGKIKVKLLPEAAPKTVENFVGLAEGTKEWTDPKTGKRVKTPLYNGTIFHRTIKGFMIQGGDPAGNGTGGPGNPPTPDEISPTLKHSKPGVMSMANAGPNTAGSQFFITVADAGFLDTAQVKYSIFGEVVEGQDVANKISERPTQNDRPLEPVVLKSVKIERK